MFLKTVKNFGQKPNNLDFFSSGLQILLGSFFFGLSDLKRLWKPSPCLEGTIDQVELHLQKENITPTAIDLACGTGA